MNRPGLSSRKILLILIVSGVTLIACDASALLSQVAPTQVPPMESELALPEPSATLSSIRPTETVQSIIPSASAPVETKVTPSATFPRQPGTATRSPTASPRTTSTATKFPSSVPASTATRTSTAKAPTGCVANPPQAKPSGMIASVTLGTKTSPTAALVPASIFSTNATIYAVVATQSAPATAIVKAEWYATDVGNAAPCNTFIDRAELSADPTIDFTLSPTNQWPVGVYRVLSQDTSVF